MDIDGIVSDFCPDCEALNGTWVVPLIGTDADVPRPGNCRASYQLDIDAGICTCPPHATNESHITVIVHWQPDTGERIITVRVYCTGFDFLAAAFRLAETEAGPFDCSSFSNTEIPWEDPGVSWCDSSAATCFLTA